MCAVRTVPYHTRQALDIYRVSERTAETKHSKFAQSFTADMQVRKKVQKCCPLQKASFGASSCPNFHLPGYDSVSRIITVATTCQCDLLHPLYNFDNISRTFFNVMSVTIVQKSQLAETAKGPKGWTFVWPQY